MLKFAILAGSLIKKCRKFEYLGISGKLELVCQSLPDQADILYQDPFQIIISEKTPLILNIMNQR